MFETDNMERKFQIIVFVFIFQDKNDSGLIKISDRQEEETKKETDGHTNRKKTSLQIERNIEDVLKATSKPTPTKFS